MQQAESSSFEIVAREDFSDVTFLLEVRHPMLAKAAKAGQFVIVMEHEEGERIPLTIADFDREAGTITLVIQAVGKTTREMQQNCRVGTSLYAVVGPMGIPSHIGGKKKVVCVGGGLGVAPIFPQARAWKESGAYVIGVLGFRNRGLVFWEDKFRAVLRRADPVHRRRLGRHQGPGHRGHQAGDREARRHRGAGGHRPAGDDEGLRRGHAPAQDPHDGEPEPGHGRRHRDVRRLPREDRRRRSSSPAWTARTSTATWSTSTTSCRGWAATRPRRRRRWSASRRAAASAATSRAPEPVAALDDRPSTDG